MAEDHWQVVDEFIAARLLPADSALEEAIRSSVAAGLPAISVSPAQGKLLYLLAQLRGARRILEIGTLGGYSTIWLARALPGDGRLISLEVDPTCVDVARANVARAGVEHCVDIRHGPALKLLPAMAAQDAEPFDFVFIDANKEDMADYFDWAVRLSRPGAVIVTDNVVRGGAVVDEASSDPRVQGVRRFYEQVADDSRVSTTVIQTVGLKGYDGFALAIVRDCDSVGASDAESIGETRSRGT